VVRRVESVILELISSSFSACTSTARRPRTRAGDSRRGARLTCATRQRSRPRVKKAFEGAAVREIRPQVPCVASSKFQPYDVAASSRLPRWTRRGGGRPTSKASRTASTVPHLPLIRRRRRRDETQIRRAIVLDLRNRQLSSRADAAGFRGAAGVRTSQSLALRSCISQHDEDKTASAGT